MTDLDPEESEYWCSDCGAEISYYEWLEHGGPTDTDGHCEACWQEFLDSLVDEEE